MALGACVVGEEQDPGCQRDDDCESGVCRAGGCFADPGSPLPPADPGPDAAPDTAEDAPSDGDSPDAVDAADAADDAR